MRTNLFFRALIASGLILLVGCASHAKRVNCDGRLTPINPTEQVVKPAVPKASKKASAQAQP